MISEQGLLPISKCNQRNCKYYKGTRFLNESDPDSAIHFCSAFRYGIPDEISYGENDHSQPHENQLDKRIVFSIGTDPTTVKPYRVENMLRPRMHGRNNLCSTIRDIYVHSTDANVKLWCRIAMRMSKNMYVALQGYNSLLAEKGVYFRADRVTWQEMGSMGELFDPDAKRKIKVSFIVAILNSHPVVVRYLRYLKKLRLPRDIEIIFVDDGSDPPLDYQNCGLRNLSIYYTNDKRPWTQGLARNLGASKAKGELLLFTDIDHIITGEAFQAVRLFDGDKMVFIRFFGIFDRYGNIISDRKTMLNFGLNPDQIRRRGLCGGCHGNTYAIRRSVFEMLGGYNPEFCTKGFHVGGAFMSEERDFNRRYERLANSEKIKSAVLGPSIFFYPLTKHRTDKSNNPFGLFHGLSLEQTPQPMIK